MKKEKPLFNMVHARVESQKTRMEECTRLDICPFCWNNLNEWHDAPVEVFGTFWAITANDHPYDGARHHYLAIARDHISSILELPPGAATELMSLFSELCLLKNIPGATIVMRTGEMSYTGATIFHLHAHIVSGASREEISNIKYPDSFITPVVGYKVPKS